jgi:two-component system chemotaxis response regulator CheB
MPLHDLIVIGASAGGVQALRVLAAGLPPTLPAAVCVVLHVGANKSALPEILRDAGPLPAAHARDGDPLTPGRILVAPPDHHLLVHDDRVTLSRGPREHHTRPAVDPLFRSAALSAGPRVIGVLLTGGGDDGSVGLQAIQACGGLVVVQDPADAEDAAMPASALAAVAPDHVEPLHRIAALLADLARSPTPPATPPPAWLVHEHMASLGKGNAMDELQQIGKPSTFVCPECRGTLWQIDGSQPPRFRCHTGHAFSLASLAAAQSQATEDALWSAVRALQEKEELLRRVAELDRQASDEDHARQIEQEADRLHRQIQVLRGLTTAEA